MDRDQLGIDDGAMPLAHFHAANPAGTAFDLDARNPDSVHGKTVSPAVESDAPSLRRAFSMFPTGVVAMCGVDEDGPVGLTINSFTSVSLDPPLVSVCIARRSFTWSRLRRLSRIGISVLAANQEALSRQLSARHTDRFAGVDYQVTPEGALYIRGGSLWLDCSIRDCIDGGDHEIVLLSVVDSAVFPDVRPLVFHQSQYRGLATPAG